MSAFDPKRTFVPIRYFHRIIVIAAPDALVGNIYAALGEHIFNIAIAEGKPEIQPDGVLDDHRRKSVAGVGDLLHPPILLCSLSLVTKLV
jgi:hypothetical protein